MKPRRVMLMIEVETSCPLKHLRNAKHSMYGFLAVNEIHQVQANVIKPGLGHGRKAKVK